MLKEKVRAHIVVVELNSEVALDLGHCMLPTTQHTVSRAHRECEVWHELCCKMPR